jgi:hypothetical protein
MTAPVNHDTIILERTYNAIAGSRAGISAVLDNLVLELKREAADA